MIRRETRQFNLSVEGINCETMYFEHLAKLVRENRGSRFNLKVYTKVATPYDFAKRRPYMPQERRRGSRSTSLPYIHIQDVEDFNDTKQRDKFIALLRNMKKAEDEFGIKYLLGYSNYTFELWMLLHVSTWATLLQTGTPTSAPSIVGLANTTPALTSTRREMNSKAYSTSTSPSTPCSRP
ncbi:MAG: RloB domain-containing protein [Atopobiaceae bacterium]|nr:RloB domain-containing protein [Atopobiaceae bacterium]